MLKGSSDKTKLEDSYLGIGDDSFDSSKPCNTNGSTIAANMRPRFQQRDLQETLTTYVKQVRLCPLEYYDVKLYDLTRETRKTFNPMNILDGMHHIAQLKKLEGELSYEEISMLN
jgi:hypothetical protein